MYTLVYISIYRRVNVSPKGKFTYREVSIETNIDKERYI